MPEAPLAPGAPSRAEEQVSGGWAGPLAAIILLQTSAAFLLQLLPVLAPLMAGRFGWDRGVIGYLTATTMASAIFCLLASSPFVRRLGPIRTVQAALLLGTVAAALLFMPFWLAPIAASVLIGIAYAPATPGGGEVLQRFAPRRHRSLVFSIKQAGVPAGGAVAGFLVPLVAEWGGWDAAVVLALALLLTAVLLAQLFRGRADAHRDPRAPLSAATVLTLRNLLLPLQALRAGSRLLPLTGVATGLALGQGTLNSFLVTYLVVGLGIDLRTAGATFAVMQAGGVAGRVLLGWLADRIGSGLAVIRLATVGSAASMLALASVKPDWPHPLLYGLGFLAGSVVAGWNGVLLAEVARRAPAGRVGEASAGSAILMFTGFVLGPAAFAGILTTGGSFAAGLLVLAAVPCAALVASLVWLPVGRRRAQETGRA
ncbi:Nitrate/nitrite transporter NarK [Tistlia consotensis]|uniref:Nitrate/nitrite transporter NarK n=1 Tax=Tistlia consotensis USBA 355 TaxID=560819 RepID=A0A1Y6CV77_9PROT|nr:MFS transporter [Tistlia consotensis]SMF77202.1 Nitrate/nitrite transporter NarK [Tistlia consotensis USBA 355]SNS14413.1 Nitrate/nitrite transporter NarK [Tistlia consotensis]